MCIILNEHFTKRFHVSVRLFSDRSQMTSKCSKTMKWRTSCTRVCHWFLSHFDVFCDLLLGNLRTSTKFTTTTSVDREKSGTRTSVSAGKRKLKMQSVGRSTTTTLNVNTNVKLWCSFATKFFAMASFKTMQDLICSSRTSNVIDDEKFFVLSEWKYT